MLSLDACHRELGRGDGRVSMALISLIPEPWGSLKHQTLGPVLTDTLSCVKQAGLLAMSPRQTLNSPFKHSKI